MGERLDTCEVTLGRTPRRSAFARPLLLFLVLGTLLSVVPGIASATHGSEGTPVFTRVDLPTSDILFDPASNKLYASVPGRAGVLGNRVVVIDPATGAVGASVFVGSEPGKLALSADGQFLYVALNGAAAVRRVQLPSLTPGLQFSLGSDPTFGPYLAEDLEVLPDDPGAVAVSRMNPGFSPRHAGVAIYDEGVKRSGETPRHTGSNVIEFGAAPSRLYGYNNESTEFGFRRMTVSASGVSTLDATSNLITGFGVDIEFDGGRVYATTGKVIDPETRTLLGTFPLGSAGPVEPDSVHGKVYFVSSGTLSEFDQTTFTLLRSFAVNGISGTPSSLANIGRGDLAFRTSADQVFLVRFQAGADATPPAIDIPGNMTVSASGPSGAVVTYSVSGHDDVDGAVPVACSPASGTLFPIGTTTVVCTATDAAGNSSAASFKVTVVHQFLSATRVSLPTNDLVFDPLSQKIYASVPGRAGALGNRVVVIDPATGAIGPSVFVGSEPGRLALSADGQFLYVALNGAAAVRRVELPSLTPGLQFSLGSDPFFGPYLADDLEVLPDDPGAVAVSRMNSAISPRHAGVAIYDEGVKRPDETPRHTGSNVIEFGSAVSRLYGYNNETTEFGFRRMTVSASGVSTLDVSSNLISSFLVDIEFDSGKVYATTGKVIDPEARSLLGTFPLSSAGLVESDSTRGKVYFLSSGTLSEFDQATFTLLRSFAVNGISGTPSSLVNIGNSDLAFRTSADQVFLAHFQDAPPPPPSVCSRQGDVLTINVPSGASVTIGRSGANFDVTGVGNPDPGCGGATVNNVNTVNVNGGGGNETVTYATTGGNLEPGATAEGIGVSEIELNVSLGAGTDTLIAQLGALNDRFTIGTAGINPNNDADADLSLAGVENLTVKGGAGPDVISAGGANGTGSAYAARVILQGEGGSDTLSGGLGNDSIDGGIGGDTFKALNVRDGADDFVGGAGEDTANYGALPASAGGVMVDPDNNPDDGANDGDNIHSDVEKVTGSSGTDVIDDGGQVVRNVFKGGGGNDSINTVDGVGNDKIDGGGGTGDSCTGDAGDTIVNCP